MFDKPDIETGPTDEEIAAADAAKKEKREATQDTLQRETDRLFRLYGAKLALLGNTRAAPILGR